MERIVKEKRIPVTVKCEWCDTEKETIYPERFRFCSAKCSNAWRRTQKVSRICEVCGATFTTLMDKKATRCSQKCVGAYLSTTRAGVLRGPNSLKARAMSTARIAAKGTTNTAPRMSGHCAHCGTYYTATIRGARDYYCSTKCKWANKRAKTRARRKGAKIRPAFRAIILERDNWICSLCGKPIPKDAKVPDPLAATVDHVIPLALGGEHSYENCKAAHFLCNSTKSHNV